MLSDQKLGEGRILFIDSGVVVAGELTRGEAEQTEYLLPSQSE